MKLHGIFILAAGYGMHAFLKQSLACSCANCACSEGASLTIIKQGIPLLFMLLLFTISLLVRTMAHRKESAGKMKLPTPTKQPARKANNDYRFNY